MIPYRLVSRLRALTRRPNHAERFLETLHRIWRQVPVATRLRFLDMLFTPRKDAGTP